jgi:hypothetical protein
MEIFLSIVGLVLTGASLIYAFVANREKSRLQKLIQIKLEDIVQGIEQVRGNTKLAHTHIDEIRRFLNGVRRSNELKTILDRAAWAEADITAAHHMLKRLRYDVTSLRNGLFGIQEVPPPADKDETNINSPN